MRVQTVLIFRTGMAVVFDEAPRQVPALQGALWRVAEALVEAVDEETEILVQTPGGSVQVTLLQFQAICHLVEGAYVERERGDRPEDEAG